jgi:hypothetical protein
VRPSLGSAPLLAKRSLDPLTSQSGTKGIPRAELRFDQMPYSLYRSGQDGQGFCPLSEVSTLYANVSDLCVTIEGEGVSSV